MNLRRSPVRFLAVALLLALAGTGAGQAIQPAEASAPPPEQTPLQPILQPVLWLPQLTRAQDVFLIGNDTYVDKGNEILIYGEVQNNSAAALTLVRVTAQFYSAANASLGSDYSYVLLKDLPPGQRSCFRIWLMTSEPYPTGWSYYRLSVSNYFSDGKALPPLTVVSHAGRYYGDTTYRINGTLRNDDSVNLRGPQVVATFYDNANRVVACDDSFLPSITLVPGETRTFLIMPIGSYLSAVTSYRLQTDAVRLP